MKLSLNSILYKLKDLAPVSYIQKDIEKYEFIGVKQYYDTSLPFSPEYLYIADISVLKREKQGLERNLVYLCVNDISLAPQEIKGLEARIIVIEGTVPSAYVLNLVLELYESMKNWDKNMHIASLEGISPQEMIELSEGIIEYPLIIFDSSFNVIAYTKHITTDYKFFNLTVKSGYTHSEIIKKVKKDKIFQLLDAANEPVVQKSAGSDQKINIYVKISGEGVLLAYACIFCNTHEPEQGYIDIMKYFFMNLTLYFKQNHRNERYGNLMYENFILGLIQNKETPVEQIAEQLQYIEGIHMEGQFALVRFEFRQIENVPLPFVARELSNLFTNVKPFIYENTLYMLKIGKNKEEITAISQSERSVLDQTLQYYDYLCGYSKIFHEITEISTAYTQCGKALQFGNKMKRGERFFYYEEFYYYHILENAAKEISLVSLQNDEYKELKRYEAEHKQDYMNILMTYLKNENNATSTGKSLYMHRNTILYTIKKIEEILQISFDNFYTKQDFIISYWIDQYLKY